MIANFRQVSSETLDRIKVDPSDLQEALLGIIEADQVELDGQVIAIPPSVKRLVTSFDTEQKRSFLDHFNTMMSIMMNKVKGMEKRKKTDRREDDRRAEEDRRRQQRRLEAREAEDRRKQQRRNVERREGSRRREKEPLKLGAQMDLDKAWHGIHYMLTGDPWNGEPPLSWAVMGGTELGEDTGYGPPRYLEPEQVSRVARALKEISPDEFSGRYDRETMKNADIYAVGDDSDPEYFTQYYLQLRDFYQDAASNGNGMIIFMT